MSALSATSFPNLLCFQKQESNSVKVYKCGNIATILVLVWGNPIASELYGRASSPNRTRSVALQRDCCFDTNVVRSRRFLVSFKALISTSTLVTGGSQTRTAPRSSPWSRDRLEQWGVSAVTEKNQSCHHNLKTDPVIYCICAAWC